MAKKSVAEQKKEAQRVAHNARRREARQRNKMSLVATASVSIPIKKQQLPAHEFADAVFREILSYTPEEQTGIIINLLQKVRTMHEDDLQNYYNRLEGVKADYEIAQKNFRVFMGAALGTVSTDGVSDGPRLKS